MTDLTPNQALVYRSLRGSAAPLGAYAILDRVRADGLRAPAQIYRALDKLLDLGLVHRLETMNAYVACRHGEGQPGEGHAGTVVFAICNACGDVTEFGDGAVEAQLARRAAERHFHVESSIVELRGRCRSCRPG